jgi:hypothetical protein
MDLKETRWENLNWIHLAQDKGYVPGSYKHR